MSSNFQYSVLPPIFLLIINGVFLSFNSLITISSILSFSVCSTKGSILNDNCVILLPINNVAS